MIATPGTDEVAIDDGCSTPKQETGQNTSAQVTVGPGRHTETNSKEAAKKQTVGDCATTDDRFEVKKVGLRIGVANVVICLQLTVWATCSTKLLHSGIGVRIPHRECSG